MDDTVARCAGPGCGRALTRSATGRPARAAALERVSGAEHPETLTARANLARWTGQAGDPAAARELFAALLCVRDRVSGPEQPETLNARGNLASWTGRAADLAEE